MKGPLRHTTRTWSEVTRDLDKAYELFESLGVATLQSSRLAAYRRLYHEFSEAGHNPARIGLQRTTRLLHAALEADQLILIATAATAQPTVWQGRLGMLIAGAPFPLEAKHHAPARDVQYECFLGAAAQLAGYEVQFREPDLAILVNDVAIACAAKRPRHSSTVAKNCRRAVRQIRQGSEPGLVALDVSAALFSDFCINTNDTIGAKEIAARTLWTFVEKHSAELRSECQGANIIGILVTAYIPALVYGDQVPTIYTTKVWSAVHLAAAGAGNSRMFLQFVNRAHAACFPSQPPGG